MTECLLIFLGPSIIQSLVFFFSNRQVLQIHPGLPSAASSTSPHSSFLAVTRKTSSPLFQMVTFPQHLGQSLWAFIGFKNQTLCLKRKVLSVNAPTGQTSIMFPLKSLSIAFEI